MITGPLPSAAVVVNPSQTMHPPRIKCPLPNNIIWKGGFRSLASEVGRADHVMCIGEGEGRYNPLMATMVLLVTTETTNPTDANTIQKILGNNTKYSVPRDPNKSPKPVQKVVHNIAEVRGDERTGFVDMGPALFDARNSAFDVLRVRSVVLDSGKLHSCLEFP